MCRAEYSSQPIRVTPWYTVRTRSALASLSLERSGGRCGFSWSPEPQLISSSESEKFSVRVCGNKHHMPCSLGSHSTPRCSPDTSAAGSIAGESTPRRHRKSEAIGRLRGVGSPRRAESRQASSTALSCSRGEGQSPPDLMPVGGKTNRGRQGCHRATLRQRGSASRAHSVVGASHHEPRG